jgi:hypothetical protein
VLGGQYGTVLELGCGALLRERTLRYKWLRKIIYVITIRMKCSKVIPKFLRLLHSASLDREVAEVIILKHRGGLIGTVKLLFDPQFTKFKNLARPVDSTTW